MSAEYYPDKPVPRFYFYLHCEGQSLQLHLYSWALYPIYTSVVLHQAESIQRNQAKFRHEYLKTVWSTLCCLFPETIAIVVGTVSFSFRLRALICATCKVGLS